MEMPKILKIDELTFEETTDTGDTPLLTVNTTNINDAISSAIEVANSRWHNIKLKLNKVIVLVERGTKTADILKEYWKNQRELLHKRNP